jgi:hypothetical protein
VINDIQYSYPREVLFNFFDNFTVAEIEKFVFDEKFRSEILRKTDRDPMLLRSTAAILLSRRATPNLVPGIPLTPDQFNYQASLLGVSPQTFPVLYRLDSRAPTKIKKEGFVPNPKKEPFTMWESVLPGLQGGGNFVSTSYASTIDKALSSKPSEIGFLSGFSKINQERVYAKINKKLLSGSRTLLIERTEQSMGAIKGDSKVIFLKTYQFKIENQIGVGVPDEVGISVEKEVLSRIIPPENVSQFRSVKY